MFQPAAFTMRSATARPGAPSGVACLGTMATRSGAGVVANTTRSTKSFSRLDVGSLYSVLSRADLVGALVDDVVEAVMVADVSGDPGADGEVHLQRALGAEAHEDLEPDRWPSV